MGGPTPQGAVGNETYVWATWLFLRSLGFIYFIAFVSYALQVKALIGRNGILPVREYLEEHEKPLGRSRFWILPTLFWWNQSDRFLQAVCWGGALLSITQIVGLVEPIALVFLTLAV